MKKLFQFVPMLELNAYQTLKIIGSYRIERIEQHTCAFHHEGYFVTLVGSKIEVKALQEEQILLTVEGFQSMSIQKLDVDD